MAEKSRMMRWMKKALALDFTEVTGYAVTVNQIGEWENFRKPIYDGLGRDWLKYCENIREEIWEIKHYGKSKNGNNKAWAKNWVRNNLHNLNLHENVNPYLVTL